MDKLGRIDECVTIGRCKTTAYNGFAAACDKAEMKISTSKAQVLHISRNPVQCSVVGGVSLKQVEKFKYLEFAFASDGRQDEESVVRSGKTSAVIQALHHSIVLNRLKLLRKAKLLVFQSTFVPILIYGQESWVMTERVRSQMPASEMRFLRKIKGVTMFDRFCNTAIQESLNIESILFRIERYQLRWFGHVSRVPQERFPKQIFYAEVSGKRPVGRPRTT